MQQCLISLLGSICHGSRQSGKILFFDDVNHLLTGDRAILKVDSRMFLFRAHFFDGCFQIMEKIRVRQYVKHRHINAHITHRLPDFLRLSRQHRLCNQRCITVSPAFFCQKLQAAFLCRAGNQLLDHRRGQQRHFQSTYARNRVGKFHIRHDKSSFIWLRFYENNIFCT